ncbi:MAG: hypothetical protein JWM68_3879 [Verrucomicrobiales bacterium]|nr:hypothetical protein [Verrucomicrobiales bacterium]
MGYCISSEETLSKAVRRILCEELDQAIARLRDDAEQVVSLHSARKGLKRIRGLFRLIRPALPADFFRAQNFRFRDINRLLSPLRDVHVQRETLEALDIPANTIALTYAKQLAKDEVTLLSEVAVRKKAHHLLSSIRRDIPRWPLHHVTDTHVCRGWRNIYKKARRAFEAALEDAAPENLHEWRKRTKDLLYAFQLLEEFGSKTTDRLFSRAKDLNDCLGNDHDFFFIDENLRQQPAARPRNELHRIATRIVKKRSKLQRNALKLGHRIFQDKPRDFEDTIRKRVMRGRR